MSDILVKIEAYQKGPATPYRYATVELCSNVAALKFISNDNQATASIEQRKQILPCPSRNNTGCDKTRLDTTRRSVEFLAGIGVETSIFILKMRDAHHHLSSNQFIAECRQISQILLTKAKKKPTPMTTPYPAPTGRICAEEAILSDELE
jgi:hypothetical protein